MLFGKQKGSDVAPTKGGYPSYTNFSRKTLVIYIFCKVLFLKEIPVLDITTSEVHVVGGVMACDESRFDVIIETKSPISGPTEAEFIFKNTNGVHGFCFASSLERLPVEQAIKGTAQQYKSISLS